MWLSDEGFTFDFYSEEDMQAAHELMHDRSELNDFEAMVIRQHA